MLGPAGTEYARAVAWVDLVQPPPGIMFVHRRLWLRSVIAASPGLSGGGGWPPPAAGRVESRLRQNIPLGLVAQPGQSSRLLTDWSRVRIPASPFFFYNARGWGVGCHGERHHAHDDSDPRGGSHLLRWIFDGGDRPRPRSLLSPDFRDVRKPLHAPPRPCAPRLRDPHHKTVILRIRRLRGDPLDAPLSPGRTRPPPHRGRPARRDRHPPMGRRRNEGPDSRGSPRLGLARAPRARAGDAGPVRFASP